MSVTEHAFREVSQAAATGAGRDVRGPLGAARLVAVLGQLPFPHTHDTGRQLRHLRATYGVQPACSGGPQHLRVGAMQTCAGAQVRRCAGAARAAGLRVG